MARIGSAPVDTDPEALLDTFERLFNGVIKDHAPCSEKRVKLERSPTWMKPEILSAMKNRGYLLQKAIKIPGKSNRNTEEWRLSTVQRLTECDVGN